MGGVWGGEGGIRGGSDGVGGGTEGGLDPARLQKELLRAIVASDHEGGFGCEEGAFADALQPRERQHDRHGGDGGIAGLWIESRGSFYLVRVLLVLLRGGGRGASALVEGGLIAE